MLAQETGTAVKSMLSLHYHSFIFLRYLHVLLHIWNRVLFLLKESRKQSFIFDITPNTNAVIVRLLSSDRVRKREGEMDG